MTLEETLQLQVLKLKASKEGSHGVLLDHFLESGQIEVRQMCAKVSPQLYDALENVCNALDMTKRQFIEAAVAQAVNRAEELLEQSGVFKDPEA